MNIVFDNVIIDDSNVDFITNKLTKSQYVGGWSYSPISKILNITIKEEYVEKYINTMVENIIQRLRQEYPELITYKLYIKEGVEW